MSRLKLFCGILFLIIGIFMFITAVSFQKVYLLSLGMEFGNMKLNVLQYIVEKCAVYFGMGMILLSPWKGLNGKPKKRVKITEQEAEKILIAACIARLGEWASYVTPEKITFKKVDDNTYQCVTGVDFLGNGQEYGEQYYVSSFLDVASGEISYGECRV